MSVGRFKSKDDYFSKKSGFTEQVIQPNPPKSRKRRLESGIPVTLLRVHFCKTVDSFEIMGEGKFHKGEYSLDDALSRHISGDANVLINPLSQSGETAFSLVKFDLSPEMEHPFSKAHQFSDELMKYGISSQIEVAGEGKGHYNLLIFHEEPIQGRPFSEALVRFGYKLFGIYPETIPPLTGDCYVQLPLQGEEVLLQRCVFLNAAGKVINDQANVLRTLEPCTKQKTEEFIREFQIVSPRRPELTEQRIHTEDSPPEQTEKIRSECLPEKKQPEPEDSTEKTVSVSDTIVKMGESIPVFMFMRSGKEFGVPLDAVEKIIPAGDITRIPGLSPYVCGVNKSGKRIFLVIDPGLFGAGNTSPEPSGSRIIIVHCDEEWYGILADSICGTTIVNDNSIAPDDHTEFCSGIAKSDNGLQEILLFDSKKLFSLSAKKKGPYVREKDGLKIEDDYVLFSQNNMRYGIQAQSVIEILPAKREGKIARENISKDTVPYHDKTLRIVDLPDYAGGKSVQSLHVGSIQERLLVVENSLSTVCIRADQITGIRHIPSCMIEYIPGDSGKIAKPFTGITRLANEEGFVLILDPVAL